MTDTVSKQTAYIPMMMPGQVVAKQTAYIAMLDPRISVSKQTAYVAMFSGAAASSLRRRGLIVN